MQDLLVLRYSITLLSTGSSQNQTTLVLWWLSVQQHKEMSCQYGRQTTVLLLRQVELSPQEMVTEQVLWTTLLCCILITFLLLWLVLTCVLQGGVVSFHSFILQQVTTTYWIYCWFIAVYNIMFLLRSYTTCIEERAITWYVYHHGYTVT